MFRDIQRLMQEHPGTRPSDPYLDVIANVDPNELRLALEIGVHNHESAVTQEVKARERVERAWKPITDFGSRMARIHSEQADTLADIERIYTDAGHTPPADLMDSTFEAADAATTPPEVLGLTPFTDIFLRQDSEYHDKTRQRVIDTERNYLLAKPIQHRRNRLGLPAKVTVWFAGLATTAGIGMGIMNFDFAEEPKDPEAKVVETAARVGTVGTTSIFGLIATAPAANIASRHYAHRVARRRLAR